MSNLPRGFALIEEETNVPVGFTTIVPEPTTPEPVQEHVPEEDAVTAFANIIPNFVEGSLKKLEQRQDDVVDILESFDKGEITPREMSGQIVGKAGAGGTLDIIGEGANAYLKGMSLLIPDFVEEPVVEGVKKGWDFLVNTEAGQVASDALEKGAEFYGEFKRDNEPAARMLESAVNVAAIASPVKVRKGAAPHTPLNKVAEHLDKRAIAQAKQKKGAFVDDLISPQQTAKQQVEQVARTEGATGILGRQKVQQTPREIEITKEVMKTDVKKWNTLQENYNILDEANQKIAAQLKGDVAKHKGVLPHGGTIDAIDNSITQLVQSNPVIVGNAQTTANRVAAKAKEIVAQKPQTASGLLEARKEFDSWVRSQKGDAVFDPASDNALTLSVREVRSSMNDVLDKAVNSTKVKAELRRQTLLYDALDNVAPKAAKEYSTRMGRLWQNTAKIVPFKAQFNRELAVLLGMSSFGAAAAFTPYLAGGLAITALGVGAVKGALSPTVKKGLAKLIGATDRAIATATNPNMIRQLRADKALALDLLKNTKTEEEEQ